MKYLMMKDTLNNSLPCPASKLKGLNFITTHYLYIRSSFPLALDNVQGKYVAATLQHTVKKVM
jgi:hypothetical protein